jgi:CheY-like chemotaxis protein
MNVLVFTHLAAGAAPIVASLGGTASIDSAHTAENALARLARTPTDVLLVEWRPVDPPLALLAAVRERHPRTAIIAIIEAPTSSTVESIAAAGAHDIQRKPLFSRELAFRLERAVKLARIGTASEELTKRRSTTELAAWTDLEAIVCGDLTAMFGEPVVYQETLPDGPLFMSQISVTHGDAGVTVGFSIGLDEGSLGLLAQSMLGVDDPDDTLRADLVGEISNTVAGAFQRSANEEGENITLGLPRACGRRRFTAPREGRTLVVGGSASGFRITLGIEIRRQRIEHLRPELLREGMVLTRDVLGDRGTLLVARGTRLTEVNAERLARLLPEYTLVQVSIAA